MADYDTIYRDEAIEAVAKDIADVLNVSIDETRELAEHALSSLPSAEAVSREDYHNLLMAFDDIDRALREYQAKDENQSADAEPSLKAIKRQIDEHWYLNAPSAEPKTDEENELKFYYVESIDDYWVGRRLDNFYYANWHKGLGFIWSHSRYLPWGEHIVDENTLWKEHTYPSEPIEIPFPEWVVGFVKKYFTEPKTGEWIPCSERLPDVGENVLFTTDIYGGYVAEGDRRADGKWWQYRWNSLLQNEDVVAWMPLPEPYKEGDNEN